MAFKIAGSLAVREGLIKANPVLLEPIVSLEIVVPEEFTGDITGDLSSRRGRVMGMEPIGAGRTRVTALAPAAEVAHYATTLRSITQGRGAFTVTPTGYEQMPPHEQQKIVEQRKKQEA
jgi:elongation factor G